MRLVAIKKSHQNEAWIDPWSAVHATSGLALGLTGVGFWTSIAAAVIYDVLEQLFERSPYGQKFFNTSGPESWGNVITDLLLFSTGWYLGDKYNRSGPARNPRTGRRMPPRPRNPTVRGERQRVGVDHVSRRNGVAGTIEI